MSEPAGGAQAARPVTIEVTFAAVPANVDADALRRHVDACMATGLASAPWQYTTAVQYGTRL